MQIDPSIHPISWFRDRNKEKNIVLKPPYQRKPVWTYDQKAYLIDSILKNYVIPEIYIHRDFDEDDNVVYNIVDGQQRIRSILDFLNDSLPLSEDYNPEYANLTFSELPHDDRKKILNFRIFTREISNATDEQVRNLFIRMNKNVVALNAQELRHATYSGSFIKTMEDLADDDYWAENKMVTPNEIRRMKDVQYISDIFISMIHGIQDKTKEMNNFYESYEAEGFPDKRKYLKRFEILLVTIDQIFPDIKTLRWKNKSDFYSLFMVLNDHFEKLPIDKKIANKIRITLLSFSKKIDQATKKENKAKHYPINIKNYVNAVTKSTTDKDRRIIRHKIISSLLNKIITKL